MALPLRATSQLGNGHSFHSEERRHRGDEPPSASSQHAYLYRFPEHHDWEMEQHSHCPTQINNDVGMSTSAQPTHWSLNIKCTFLRWSELLNALFLMNQLSSEPDASQIASNSSNLCMGDCSPHSYLSSVSFPFWGSRSHLCLNKKKKNSFELFLFYLCISWISSEGVGHI